MWAASSKQQQWSTPHVLQEHYTLMWLCMWGNNVYEWKVQRNFTHIHTYTPIQMLSIRLSAKRAQKSMHINKQKISYASDCPHLLILFFCNFIATPPHSQPTLWPPQPKTVARQILHVPFACGKCVNMPVATHATIAQINFK